MKNLSRILLFAWLIASGLLPCVTSLVAFHQIFLTPILFPIQAVLLFLYFPFVHFVRFAKESPFFSILKVWTIALVLVFLGTAIGVLIFPESFDLHEVNGGPIPGDYGPPPEPLGFLIYLVLPLNTFLWSITGTYFFWIRDKPSDSNRSISTGLKWFLAFGLMPWFVFLSSILPDSNDYLAVYHNKLETENLEVLLTFCSLFQCIPMLCFFPYRTHQLKAGRTWLENIIFFIIFVGQTALFGLLLLLMFDSGNLIDWIKGYT